MKASARIVAAFVALAGASGIVFAQSDASPAPKSAEDCLKSAFELAQTAESKKLADSQLDKIEALLTKMESHCDAKQFAEAAAVAKDITTAIEAK